jgi:hypothetical protein
MQVAQLGAVGTTQPAGIFGPSCRVLLRHWGLGYHAPVPSRYEVLVGLIVALGVIAVIVAFKATPPPWVPR